MALCHRSGRKVIQGIPYETSDAPAVHQIA